MGVIADATTKEPEAVIESAPTGKDFSRERYNIHGPSCKGHQSYYLDGSIDDPHYRLSMRNAIDSAIKSYSV